MRSDDAVLDRRTNGERRSQAERRSEAEAAILKAAVRLVAERGLERFTLADVGERAGYSRGLPAHYFGSKEGLTGALARHIVMSFGRGLVRSEKHQPGLAHLLGMAGFYFDGAARDPISVRALFVVLGEALTNETVRKAIAELNARLVASITDDIRAGISAGDIRRGVNAKAEAALVLAGLRGAAAQWLTDPEGVDLKALRSEFLAGLKRRLSP